MRFAKIGLTLTEIAVVTLLVVSQGAPVRGAEKPVEFKVADGTVLRGIYYSAAAHGPGVILLHMCRADASTPWGPLATDLAKAGFHVLAFDYRGYGRSDGQHVKLGELSAEMKLWKEKFATDADDALKLLQSQPGVDGTRIAAVGASCGVYISLLLAERHPEIVKSVALLSGPIDDGSKETVRRLALPVFGVASEEDGPAPDWMSAIFKSSTSARSKLLLYKKAGHGTDMFQTQPALRPMIVSWLQETLWPSSAAKSAKDGMAKSTPEDCDVNTILLCGNQFINSSRSTSTSFPHIFPASRLKKSNAS